MCAICGICLDDGEGRVDAELLRRMNASLAHRGPDGEGYYLKGRVGLGHRRLAIIDLAGGDQPIYNEDGTIVIVFNGEIYNYKELRDELSDRGHRFATASDTEVIVHLYEDRGPDCVDGLNGMFAFAIWDERRQRLFAARDRLGEKPFYYSQQRGRFLFASELKALRKDPTFAASVSVEALDDFLAYGYVPAPRTIFDGVFKLPPAHTLIWQNGRVAIRRYWDTEVVGGERGAEEEYVRELRQLLDDAIRIRLRSDVPLGAFLSGGVDSSAIVALASRHTSGPIKTFAVGFGEPDFDELRYARLVAERYGTDHQEIVVDDLDTALFPELVAHFDEPFGDPSVIPTYYVTREARRFVKVCLSGDGGDEVFGGYDQYAECLRDGYADWVPLGLRGTVFGGVSNLLPDHVRGKGWLRRMAVSGAVRYQRRVGVFDACERRRLLLPELAGRVDASAWLFRDAFAELDGDRVAASMRADQQTYLPDDILVKVDRNSMKHGLEVRVPFLDHLVVGYANRLPTEMKVRPGARKYIFKRMLAELLPEEIIERPKHGFGLPLRHWLRGDLQDFARDLLLAPSSRTRAFFRGDTVRGLLTGHQRRGRDLSDRLWALLWLEQWCRTNGV